MTMKVAIVCQVEKKKIDEEHILILYLQVFSTVIVRLIPGSGWYGAAGMLLAASYQFLLSSAGLRSFVLHGSRGDGSRMGLLDANREGLCSCVGYLALYLIGVQLGKFLFCKRYVVIFVISLSHFSLFYSTPNFPLDLSVRPWHKP